MRSVSTAEFKAKLAQYLRIVRNGESVIVLDRKTPTAKVSPIEKTPNKKIFLRDPLENPRGLDSINLPPIVEDGTIKTNSLEALLKERGNR